MSYIGLGAIQGVAVDIPPFIRVLCNSAIFSEPLRQFVDAGPEVHDADTAVTEFKYAWWLPGQLHDLSEEKFFNLHSAEECLIFHEAQKRNGGRRVDGTTTMKDLFSKNYVLPTSVFGDVPVPPDKEPCTRCRLYRAVAIGSQNKLRDLRNLLQGGSSLFRTTTQLSIRKASSFNQLYEAAVNKEATTTTADDLPTHLAVRGTSLTPRHSLFRIPTLRLRSRSRSRPRFRS